MSRWKFLHELRARRASSAVRTRLLRLTLMWLVAGVVLLVLGHLWWASACLVITGFHAWAFWAQRPVPDAESDAVADVD